MKSMHGVEPNEKLWKIGAPKFVAEVDTKGKTDRYKVIGTLFLYVTELESSLQTLPTRRTIAQRRKQNASPQVPDVEREHVEEHLAQCRAFLLEWTSKKRPAAAER